MERLPRLSARAPEGALRRGYRRDVDGLRALAVILVVVFHGFPGALPGGFIGVDIFFVISGFLITGILLEDLHAQRFSLADFYLRRIRRLFPALLLMMTATLVLGACCLLREENATLGKMTMAGALSIANVWLYMGGGYFDPAAELNPLLHLWSLGVEEQFYLLWPLSLYWARGSRLRVLWLLGLTIGVSLALSIAGSGSWPTASFYLPFARLWELAAGAALAYVAVTGALERTFQRLGPQCGTRYARSLAMLGLGLIMLGLVITDSGDSFPGWRALLPVTGAVLLLAVGERDPWTLKLFGSRPMVALGLISYPLYLWHWPILSFSKLLSHGESGGLQVGLLLLASLLLAVATYRWVELPLKHLRAPVYSRALMAGMCLMAVAGFAGFKRWIPGVEPPTVFVRGLAEDESRRLVHAPEPCDHETWITPRAMRFCQQFRGSSAPSRSIVVWGDSHADTWSYAFYQASKALGVRTIVFTTHGCAPLLGVRMSGWRATEGCREQGLGEAVLSSIERIRPSHVVLVGRWSLYVHGWLVNGRLQQNTHFLTTSASGPADVTTSREALAESLPRTLRALAALAPTTIFDSVPVLQMAPDSGLLRDPRHFEPSLAAHREHQQFAHALIEHSKASGIAVVDPAGKLCAGGSCRALLDGQLLYKDDNHLTAQATLAFMPEVYRAMGAAPAADDGQNLINTQSSLDSP